MKELILIQEKLKAPKSQWNAFGKYNYRSCEDILEGVKPLLKEYNCVLTVSDEVKELAGYVFIEATAKITCGDNSAFVTAQAGLQESKKGMDIAQIFGSTSSYARKYALNGLLLIDDSKDADGDTPERPQGKKKTTPKPTTLRQKPVFTEDNFKKAKENKATIAKIKELYSITAEVEKKYLAYVEAK